MSYLSHFRSNPHYAAQWSPEIYSLSHYVNEHGFQAKSIICVDWGLYTQFQALAPKTTAAADARLLANFPGPFSER